MNDNIRLILRQWTNYQGRSTRASYWFGQLFWLFVGGVGFGFGFDVAFITPTFWTVPVTVALLIFYMIPQCLLAIRRLHDSGKSGFWMFIGLIPVVGELILVVMLLLPGNSHENRYGSNPFQGPNHRTTTQQVLINVSLVLLWFSLLAVLVMLVSYLPVPEKI